MSLDGDKRFVARTATERRERSVYAYPTARRHKRADNHEDAKVETAPGRTTRTARSPSSLR
jgi:hypothetical protein